MRVLVIGSGGREHALVWKIAQSKLVNKIFSVPGNGGIEGLAECLDIKADDIPGLLDFAVREKIDLTVVGPEIPLTEGIVDEFQKSNLKVFGPAKNVAKLESSKVFAKELMRKYSVPTADFRIFDSPEEAIKYVNQRVLPCVVKAEGLAAGKGVVVCQAIKEAEQAINSIMKDRIFGSAGKRIVVEDCLKGQEASIIVFTDSKEVVPLASSQDHKRVYDFDQGANTGGMGAYSPAPVVTKELNHQILETIVCPVIKALSAEGLPYKGILYVGIMITSDGPKVLEFNVRFGDPETQAILPRLNSDLVEVMLATTEGKLSQLKNSGALNWDRRSCVCVVCASGGYPGKYEKGKEIAGLDKVKTLPDIVVFHAGTKKINSHTAMERCVTNGGRVLGVTGLGNTIKEAIEQTYEAVKVIHFDGMHYRKDIAQRALGSVVGAN
jgi:phosphoribosylamine--glycine ligase